MKVKIRSNTCYGGEVLRKGDEIDVSHDVARRWAFKGIADIVVEATIEEEKAPVYDMPPVPYKDMKASQLYKKCIEKGLTVEPQKSKLYYIEVLENASKKDTEYAGDDSDSDADIDEGASKE